VVKHVAEGCIAKIASCRLNATGAVKASLPSTFASLDPEEEREQNRDGV
jgi:hypothetical protein